ncbi:MAG: bifunctional diguanylate cyclase/phosphodiesterase [Synechococcales cyanobacterium T60_A2020_003]|nr:bifunctional diguanylate cyclase/phosphodiesterase [Synechococcales cyanobacterium T60_A2020_003]
MAESAFYSSETYLSFLNGLKDIVIAVDDQCRIIFTNTDADSWFKGKEQIFSSIDSASPYSVLDTSFRALPYDQLPLQRTLRGESLKNVELLVTSADSAAPIWVSISGGPLPQRGGIISIRDISKRKQMEADQLHPALCDDLTNLPNRNLFMEQVNRALSRFQVNPSSLMAILFIDLDRFKSVNDNLGHQIGNQLLQELGRRLRECLRPEDAIARLGGDEFAVLLDNIPTHAKATEVAERLRNTIAHPFHLQQQDIYIDASIGIAFGPNGYLHPEDWLRDADTAMYQVKNSPDEHWRVFDSALKIQQDQRIQTEAELRRAITNHELRLHYQPIVSISNEEILGFEALVRWQHPERGLLLPSSFIPIAEETGLIVPLGWWVLREACQQMKGWQTRMRNAQELSISINMSSKQFAQKYMVERLQEILQEIDYSPHQLTIEITESVLIDHSDSIVETLEQLQAMGIKLSIDDFGTGYSSLSYLHRFPFNTLKIDRSFIENADQDLEKLEILQSVVRLAWNLGVQVTAEGVETQKHYAQLKALRCDSAQGYLFARPLAPEDAEALIQSRS